jgi:hypothetical protein
MCACRPLLISGTIHGTFIRKYPDIIGFVALETLLLLEGISQRSNQASYRKRLPLYKGCQNKICEDCLLTVQSPAS